MARDALTVASVAAGPGQEVVAVVCWDEKAASFQNAFHAALEIVNVSHHEVMIEESSFDGRRGMFPHELVRALEELVDRGIRFFDKVRVTRGAWSGLEVIGLGGTRDQRKKAGKIALGLAALHDGRVRSNTEINEIAALYDGRSVPVHVASSAIEGFGRSINRRLAAWRPETHRYWDPSSRRKIRLMLLCQVRGSRPGNGGVRISRELLISQVLPFVMSPRFVE